MNIAVYCGSSFGNDKSFEEDAKILGREIAKGGHTLVYGGSKTGLMGCVADAALENGGRVIGVSPDVPLIRERLHENLTECYFTSSMPERKTKMIELSDAFVALPGGLGTLDEISEILSLNRLGIIKKPSVLFDINGFYKTLYKALCEMVSCGFAENEDLDNLLLSENIGEIMSFLER